MSYAVDAIKGGEGERKAGAPLDVESRGPLFQEAHQVEVAPLQPEQASLEAGIEAPALVEEGAETAEAEKMRARIEELEEIKALRAKNAEVERAIAKQKQEN